MVSSATVGCVVKAPIVAPTSMGRGGLGCRFVARFEVRAGAWLCAFGSTVETLLGAGCTFVCMFAGTLTAFAPLVVVLPAPVDVAALFIRDAGAGTKAGGGSISDTGTMMLVVVAAAAVF
jgi:hypothetical protein